MEDNNLTTSSAIQKSPNPLGAATSSSPPSSPASAMTDEHRWKRLAKVMIEEAARRKLPGEAPLKLFVVLVCESFLENSRQVWVHGDKVLPAFTGIHSQNLKRRAIAVLQRYHMIKAAWVNGGYEFKVEPRVAEWTAPTNKNIPAVERKIAHIRKEIGQLHLQFEPKELNAILEQFYFEAEWAGSQCDNQSLNLSDCHRNHGGREPLSLSDTTAQPLNLSVAQSERHAPHHTNVSTNVVNGQRSTLLAQRLQSLEDFFAETDGKTEAAAEVSPNRSLGFWRGLVRYEWDRIETEMGEIRMQERQGYKSDSRIKRLTWLMREALSPGSKRWKQIFPGTR
jgi:hypothetical protein